MTDETGRRLTKVVIITPEMIEAGCSELVFDSELIRSDVVFDVLVAALVAGGFEVRDKLNPLKCDGDFLALVGLPEQGPGN